MCGARNINSESFCCLRNTENDCKVIVLKILPVLCLHEYDLLRGQILGSNSFNFERRWFKMYIRRKFRIDRKDMMEVWLHCVSEIQLIFVDVFNSLIEGEFNLAYITTVWSACGSQAVISTHKVIFNCAKFRAAISIASVSIIALQLNQKSITTNFLALPHCRIKTIPFLSAHSLVSRHTCIINLLIIVDTQALVQPSLKIAQISLSITSIAIIVFRPWTIVAWRMTILAHTGL